MLTDFDVRHETAYRPPQILVFGLIFIFTTKYNRYIIIFD